MRHIRIYIVHPIWLRPWASIEGFYKVMWELQHFSTNMITTKISLLLGENTSLTLSQIPHSFVGLLSLSYSPLLLSCGVF